MSFEPYFGGAFFFRKRPPMRVLLLALALLATGCAHVPAQPSKGTVPGFPEVTLEGDAYPPREVGLVVFLFTQEYEATFRKHPDFSRRHIAFKPLKGTMTGVVSYNSILVEPRGDGIWATALTHELTHAALERLEGDGDADHEKVQGTARARWTVEHNAMIARLRVQVRTALQPSLPPEAPEIVSSGAECSRAALPE
jgi:hypothetical protein